MRLSASLLEPVRLPTRVRLHSKALVYRYARLLAAAGRFDEAERLFVGRFLSRVEGGTNPRGVWLEVRLARADSLAARGACADARRVLASLARPVRTLPFTRDGMAEQLRTPALARHVAEVSARCTWMMATSGFSAGTVARRSPL